jgi:hypothetical protein
MPNSQPTSSQNPQIVVLGTSITWGQGLPEDKKIHTLVKSMLEARHIFPEESLAVCQLSHSGASIGYMDNDRVDPTRQPRVHNEVPTFYPTMLQQLEEFDEAYNQACADQVRLVLIEGGINDVGIDKIVNPLFPTALLKNEIDNHCYGHMKLYLQTVAAKFPNAKIIVLAYYRFITDESASDLIHSFVTAMGGLPGTFDDALMKAFGELEKQTIVRNCEFFRAESTLVFQRAIDEVNDAINPNGNPRIMLAVPDIQPRNAALAGNPYIFAIHRDGTAQDPIADERMPACEEAGFPRTVVRICKVASVGHPNVKGAQAYADSIVALLDRKPMPTFTAQFEIGSAGDIYKEDTWFRDKDHRYVLFRGMNVATRSKLPPYVPILPIDVTTIDWSTCDENGLPAQFAGELEAVKPEFARLQRIGINLIRFVVIWKALESEPNPTPDQLSPDGERYMRLIKALIDVFYALDMFVLIDFHQDIAHELYGGDGFPDWALAIDKDHKRPAAPPKRASPKWMLRYYDTILTTLDKQVRHTLQSFWRNNVQNAELSPQLVINTRANQARTHLEKTVGAVARYLAEHGAEAVLGYEPFNEPHSVGLGATEYERDILPDFYRNVLTEIRKWTRTAFLFAEPRVDWTSFDADGPEFAGLHTTDYPYSLLDLRQFENERVAFAFHFYDDEAYVHGEPSVIPPNIPHGVNMAHQVEKWPHFFRQLRGAATSRKLIPFMTEFGGDQDWTFKTNLRPDLYKTQIRAYMDCQFKQIEALLLNAAYWDYDLYNSEEGKNNWNDENSSLLGPNRQPRQFDIVARLYPMRSSAEPIFLDFDIETRHGVIILQGQPVNAPTVIFVPAELHYPEGFEVRATNGEIAWDADRQLLFWQPDSQATDHQIVVSPRHSFKQSALPADAFDLLPACVFYWQSDGARI